MWPQAILNKYKRVGEVEKGTKILICWQKTVLLILLWNMLASLLNSVDEHNREYQTFHHTILNLSKELSLSTRPVAFNIS
jgi:hypothetical protein